MQAENKQNSPKTTFLRAAFREQLDRPPCTLSLPGKNNSKHIFFPNIQQQSLGNHLNTNMHYPQHTEVSMTHIQGQSVKHAAILQLFPRASPPACCAVLIVPGIMVHGATNCWIINPRGLEMQCHPALCSVSQGKKESFQRKPAVSLSAPLGWGVRFVMPNFPSVALETGSCLDFSWLFLNSRAQVLCEGKLNEVAELWQLTLAKSWPLLCSVIGIYIWKGSGGRRTLRNSPLIACLQRTSASCAVKVNQLSWSWRDLTKHRLHPTGCLH